MENLNSELKFIVYLYLPSKKDGKKAPKVKVLRPSVRRICLFLIAPFPLPSPINGPILVIL